MSKRYPGNFITGNPVALSQTSNNNGVYDLKDNYTATSNNTWQEPDGIYEIGKSLRFRGSTVASYLTRTPTVSGNRKTWTYSTWFKIGDNVNGVGRHFGYSPQYGGDSANESQINLMLDGTIRVYDSGGGAGYFNVATTTVFRDPTAWYHCVVAVNTTLDIPTDRVKIYVNGVRQPISTTTQVSQNQNTGWNHTFLHKLGAPGYSGTTNNCWDGYLAEINHVDGQELDPSYFGYFDINSGIWFPKRYTGAYGTNGFYLPFTENGSTAQLGKNFANGSNYLTYSEQFNNGNWSKPAAPVAPTISTDATTAPDGTTTADAVVYSGSTTHPCYQEYTVAIPVGQSWTASMYVKQATGTAFNLQCTLFYGAGVLQDGYNFFTFDSATKITSSNGGNSYMTVGSQYIGNGWHRVWATNTNQSGSAGTYVRVSIGQQSAPTAWSIYCWGAQLTLGTTLLPYTQTTSSAISYDFTPNNFSVTAGATYDSMVDSPTNVFTTATDIGGVVPGNYCTLNPLEGAFGNITIYDGNLTLTSGGNSGYHNCGATIAPEGNKGYFEVTCTNSPNGHIGVSSAIPYYTNYAAAPTADTIYLGTDGSVYNIYTTVIKSGSIPTPATGDVIMVAFDFTNSASKKLWFGRNGTWGLDASSATGNPAAGTNATVTSSNLLSTSTYRWYFGLNNGAAFGFNFGARPFAYTPPTGFGSLCTTNMQARGTSVMGNAAAQPKKWFDIVLSGGNTTGRTVNGMQFQPDLVIFKNRDGDSNRRWSWFDSVRGPNAHITSQNTETESTPVDTLTSFNSDGFTVGADAASYGTNQYAERWVQWCWKQSPTSGLNIVSYTGDGTNNRAITHNLGVAPSFIIVKDRSVTYNWDIYHKDAGLAATLIFTTAGTRNVSAFGSSTPTSSNFYTQNDYTNTSGSKLIAYVFADVPGFSKFGTYLGNGAANGTYVYTGFTPKFILIKSNQVGSYWEVFDMSRQKNGQGVYLRMNVNTAEAVNNSYPTPDVLSNGFKCRSVGGSQNDSGYRYYYAAFAESPFALNNRAKY